MAQRSMYRLVSVAAAIDLNCTEGDARLVTGDKLFIPSSRSSTAGA
ncbi:hypothetical protein [Rhizobium yanglingense]